MAQSLKLKTFDQDGPVLASFLERYFFDDFRSSQHTKNIEIFLKGSCPSKCSYCYLQNNLSKLYPLDKEDDDNIISNLKILLKFYIENRFRASLEIFSGRIMDTPFGLRVLQTIYDAFKDQHFIKPSEIIVPDDMQFLLDDDQTAKVEEFIEKFSRINILLVFSCSVDGKPLDHLRFGSRADEFYTKLRDFANKHNFFFHPMVSAMGIGEWRKNYKWWTEWDPSIILRTMFLEVRNDDWSDERIRELLLVMDDMVEWNYKKLGRKGFYEKFIQMKRLNNRSLIEFISPLSGNTRTNLSCNIQKCLHIRVPDLAIIPCHRTCYEHYVTGKFLVEDNEITGLEVENVPCYLAIHSAQPHNLPLCSECWNRDFCLGPCLGANYESMGDMFMPPPSVCNMEKASHMFLVFKYFSMGLLQYVEKNDPKRYSSYKELLTNTESLFKSDDKYAIMAKEVASTHKSTYAKFLELSSPTLDEPELVEAEEVLNELSNF